MPLAWAEPKVDTNALASTGLFGDRYRARARRDMGDLQPLGSPVRGLVNDWRAR
jgi:hypothetical protein